MQLNVANSSQYHDCNIRESVNTRVIEDVDIGHADTYYYRPALQTDNQGNLFVVFGYSSDTIYPSLAVLKIDSDDSQLSNITSKLIKEGTRNTEVNVSPSEMRLSAIESHHLIPLLLMNVADTVIISLLCPIR